MCVFLCEGWSCDLTPSQVEHALAEAGERSHKKLKWRRLDSEEETEVKRRLKDNWWADDTCWACTLCANNLTFRDTRMCVIRHVKNA